MILTLVFSTAAAAASVPTQSDVAAPSSQVEEFIIEVSYETRSKGDNGSSSSSNGRYMYTERILQETGDCTTKRFDIAGEDRPLAEWQWPVEVERCSDGIIRLLNTAEMEARRDAFHAEAGIEKAACGSYYFTWNVFKIECDPEAILETIETIDLEGLELIDGSEYQHGTSSMRLSRDELSDPGSPLGASIEVDADEVRRAEAKTIVIFGELQGEPVDEEEAMQRVQAIEVTGTTRITFVFAEPGEITRTVVTEAEVSDPAEGLENRYSKTVTKRKKAGSQSLRPSS